MLERMGRENVRSTAQFAVLADKIEQEYRTEKQGYMPIKYRSAKSVIAAALMRGVPLFDTSGRPRSKNAIANDCRIK